MIILDTNVLSEVIAKSPAPRVLRWFSQHPASDLYTTAITEAEMLYGAAILADGKRKTNLSDAIAAIFEEDFKTRVLAFNHHAAREFAKIAAARRTAGLPVTQADTQIAAIAKSRGAALATRNPPDFEASGLTLLNPWD